MGVIVGGEHLSQIHRRIWDMAVVAYDDTVRRYVTFQGCSESWFRSHEACVGTTVTIVYVCGVCAELLPGMDLGSGLISDMD